MNVHYRRVALFALCVSLLSFGGSAFAQLSNFGQTATKALTLTAAAGGSGQQVVFNRSGDVWMMNTDGTDLRQVTHVGGVQGTTRLSDNGVLLYCTGSRLYVSDADGSNARAIQNVSDPSYEFELSPDGAQVVFGEGPSTHFSIFAINTDGTARRTVRSGGDYHQMANGWGKDGFVYFVECVYGDPYTQHVLRVPQAGGNPESLVSYFSQTPSVSSGSGKVLFLYNQSAPKLRIMNASGSGQTDIPNTPQGVGLFPALSADGATAFYVYNGNIWSVGVDGSGLRQLTTGGGIASGLDVGFAAGGAPAALSVTTGGSLPGGTVGEAYSQTLEATGGTAPYAWSLASGSLPAGLNLSSGGVLGGSPTAAGTFSFTVRVKDGKGQTATKALTLTVAADSGGAAATATVGVKFGMDLPDAFANNAKVTVTGLPAGLKYNTVTRKIEGVPTKSGTFTVTFAATGVTSQSLEITVGALPAWAWGVFNGRVSVLRGQMWEPGAVSMTITAVGKAAGKYSYGGTNYTFAAASYSRCDVDGTFTMEAQAKSGKVLLPLEIKVYRPVILDSEFTVPQSLGVAEGWLDNDREHEPPLLMWRDVWKDADMVSLPLDFAGYYTATLPGNDKYGSGYLALTADKAGKVKTAGKLADGTAVSLAGTLVVDDVGRVFAVLYTSPADYKGGSFYALAEFAQPVGGVYKTLRLRDGGPALWQSLNPQATETYGDGFSRRPELVGGWYSQTENLYTYYAGKKLTAGTDAEALTPELTVGTVPYGSVCWDPSGVVLTPVLKSGIMTGLTAPAAGKPTDPENDGTWSYSATNTVGLKVSLTRASGIFKGSFLAWFDYPEKKHVSKSLSFEGALTPERVDKTDGIEGRGFFLWPDKSLSPAYSFKWSYDFLISTNGFAGGEGAVDGFTGFWRVEKSDGGVHISHIFQQGNNIWMNLNAGSVSGQAFSIEVPYEEPDDEDNPWAVVQVKGTLTGQGIQGTYRERNKFGSLRNGSYTATKLVSGIMSAAGSFNVSPSFNRSGEAVGCIDDERELKVGMAVGNDFTAELEFEDMPKVQLPTGLLRVSDGYVFELTCMTPDYRDSDFDEPATDGWVNLTRNDTRVVGTYDLYFRGGLWHVSGSFDVPCTATLSD